jgi:hypothetical protein
LRQGEAIELRKRGGGASMTLRERGCEILKNDFSNIEG